MQLAHRFQREQGAVVTGQPERPGVLLLLSSRIAETARGSALLGLRGARRQQSAVDAPRYEQAD